ncbi:hypothetical protein PG985_014592 [Apiospora marii]|uniref:AvrStb6 n=1 Tax=Apiospora marii TaxID=335849 RepID=A0ABR1R4H9_9PEZI
MRFFNTVLLLATTSLVAAGDVCPGTYCHIGDRCGYDANGPHCCGAGNDKNVLQCVNGKWAIRNVCKNNEFCTCTGSHDLICKKISKEAAAFEA